MVAETGQIAASPGRSAHGSAEVLYGVHAVLEALRAGRRRLDAVYLARRRGTELKDIETRAADRQIPVHRISPEELTRIAGTHQHQGIGLRAGPYPLQPLDVLEAVERLASRRQMLVVLDNIVDPHNLGAVVRTALAVEAAAVIIPRDRAAGPTPAVSKASAGALEHVQLIQVTNLVSALKLLKKSGWWVHGLDRSGNRSIFESDLTGPTAVVVGNEQRGIRPLVKKQCDRLWFIPQSGPVASLNASVAAAVCLYEAFRQRSRRFPKRGEKR